MTSCGNWVDVSGCRLWRPTTFTITTDASLISQTLLPLLQGDAHSRNKMDIGRQPTSGISSDRRKWSSDSPPIRGRLIAPSGWLSRSLST